MSNYAKIFKDGLITQNPMLVQLLGMCPALAVTTSLENGIGMGLAATVVLTGANIVISALRKFIPQKIRIMSYVVIISGFVTVVDMLLKAYFPALSGSLGIFIPLIVVNCIILARAEAFASANKVLPSGFDGLCTGLGFTAALIIISSIREILGAGAILGYHIMPDSYRPVVMAIKPPGAFIVLGLLLGGISKFRKK